MKLVQAWIEIHREDLLANWRLAVAGEPVLLTMIAIGPGIKMTTLVSDG